MSWSLKLYNETSTFFSHTNDQKSSYWVDENLSKIMLKIQMKKATIPHLPKKQRKNNTNESTNLKSKLFSGILHHHITQNLHLELLAILYFILYYLILSFFYLILSYMIVRCAATIYNQEKKKIVYFFIYLAVSSLNCCMQDIWFWCLGSSSLARDWSQAPWGLGAQSLSHWTTREIPILIFYSNWNLKKKKKGTKWHGDKD